MWRDVPQQPQAGGPEILGVSTEELFELQRAIRLRDAHITCLLHPGPGAIRRGIIEAGHAGPRFRPQQG